MNNPQKFNKYFFLFAHPDDEMYCSVLINRLISDDKKVVLAYATSGEEGGDAKKREREVLDAIGKIGIQRNDVRFLRVPEKELLNRLIQVVDLSLKIAKNLGADCVIGQDYEGGHEGHDAASFCAAEVVKLAKVDHYFVFPIYHGKPDERKGARFKRQRKDYFSLTFGKNEKRVKKGVLDSHQSQKKHFEELQKSSNDYFDLLFSREVYFRIETQINFKEKPISEIGYEYHRNGFKYVDFKKAIKAYKNTVAT